MTEETLSFERDKLHAEVLEQATTPDEDKLIKTIFDFIEGQDKKVIKRVEERLKGINYGKRIFRIINEIDKILKEEFGPKLIK